MNNLIGKRSNNTVALVSTFCDSPRDPMTQINVIDTCNHHYDGLSDTDIEDNFEQKEVEVYKDDTLLDDDTISSLFTAKSP